MPINKSVLIIINPFSGVGRKQEIEACAEKILQDFDITFRYTKYAKHAVEISRNGVRDDFDIIVAVGGDGSVNEIGSQLINTKTSLAIIPTGSGNGLARCLGIPLNPEEAFKTIANNKSKLIDTGEINGVIFLGTAGIGFDAHIGHLFEKKKVRGFFSYLPLIFKSYFSYNPQMFNIQLDNKDSFQSKAWLLTFSNSNQWGNNAYISPESDLYDGYFNLIILKKPKISQIPKLAFQLFKGNILKSTLIQSHLFKEAKIEHQLNVFHVDGESVENTTTLNIDINPQSLKVIS